MKKAIMIIIVGALGAGIAYRLYQKKHLQQVRGVEQIQLAEGVPVRVFETQLQELQRTVSLSGTIEAWQQVAIAPTITERIATIQVGTGQRVAAGDLLVTLDPKTAELVLTKARQTLRKLRETQPAQIEIAAARLQEAKAALKLSTIERQRQRQLYEQEATTLQRVQEAENQCERCAAAVAAAGAELELARRKDDIAIAETQMNQAEDDLEDHYLRAPFAGVVSMKTLEVGAIAEKNKPIFQLLDVEKVFLVLDVPELHITAVAVEMGVEISVDSLRGVRFGGTVAEIDPIADPAQRAYRTKILIANPDQVLLPGMFGRAEIVLEKIKDAVAIPTSAIKNDPNGTDVLTVDDDNTVERVEISTVATFGPMTRVTAGLGPGGRVISLAQGFVQAGQKVIEVKE